MSHSRGKLHKARFCPWCGIDALERDNFQNKGSSHVEFICAMCGAGFRLMDSTRRQAAANIFRETRKLRVEDSDRNLKQKYKAACHKKFKEFRRQQREIAHRKTTELMRAWIESAEAQELRAKI